MNPYPSLDAIPSSLSEREFWRLFGRLEHEALDFKEGVPKEISNTIAAMAMTDGGLIIHGVADDRQIVGCPLSQKTQDGITRRAAECGVDVQLCEVAIREKPSQDGKLLTICAVPEVRGRIVTTPDGRLLRRVGGDSRPLRSDALARFVRERELRSGEDEPIAARTSADSFDIGAIDAALQAEGRPSVEIAGVDEAGPRNEANVLRALSDLGVATPAAPPLATQVLRAATILFAVDPRNVLRGAAVQLARRAGTGSGPGPAVARIECAGPFAETVQCCLEFIAEHTGQAEVVAGVRRETLPAYPTAVLREAVVNALAHRDYNLSGATVDITVRDDRVEVRSPGSLPGHITKENMRNEHYSRNPRIMRVLKSLGLVEEFGEGIDRMYREMEARLLAPPTFEATASSVTVTLRSRSLVDAEDQAWLLGLAETATASERLALIAARNDGAVTRRALRSMMAEAEVDAVLEGCVAKGLLHRVGKAGGTRYVLGRAVGGNARDTQNRRRDRLLEEARRLGAITSTDAARLLQTSAEDARKLLRELERAGALRAEGKTRGRRYRPTY